MPTGFMTKAPKLDCVKEFRALVNMPEVSRLRLQEAGFYSFNQKTLDPPGKLELKGDDLDAYPMTTYLKSINGYLDDFSSSLGTAWVNLLGWHNKEFYVKVAYNRALDKQEVLYVTLPEKHNISFYSDKKTEPYEAWAARFQEFMRKIRA